MEGENTQVNIGEEKKKAKATVQWKQDAFNSALFIELIKKTPKSWEEFYAGMNAHYKRDTGSTVDHKPHLISLRAQNAIKKLKADVNSAKGKKNGWTMPKLPANWEEITKHKVEDTGIAHMWTNFMKNGLDPEIVE